MLEDPLQHAAPSITEPAGDGGAARDVISYENRHHLQPTTRERLGLRGSAWDYAGALGTTQERLGPRQSAWDHAEALGTTRKRLGPRRSALDHAGALGTTQERLGPRASVSKGRDKDVVVDEGEVVVDGGQVVVDEGEVVEDEGLVVVEGRQVMGDEGHVLTDALKNRNFLDRPSLSNGRLKLVSST
ncbi:hypothetical protein FHG87_004290 [Trinorchestia longiramus]|nr:hypothetical protein FHG87_004290 [Trinorchestia longiramus]